jgi:hypothetical protein
MINCFSTYLRSKKVFLIFNFFLIILLITLCFPSIVNAILYVNELFPNPTGNEETDEWVEIFNVDSSSVDLNGYWLKDAADHEMQINSSKTNGTTEVAANAWIVIFRNGDSSFSLNNSGSETVTLYNPDKTELLNSFTYTDSVEGKSWGRVPDAGEISELALDSTPWSANQIPPTPTSTPSPTEMPTPTSSPTPSPTPAPTTPPTVKPTSNSGILPKSNNTELLKGKEGTANSQDMLSVNTLGIADDPINQDEENEPTNEIVKPNKSPYLIPFLISGIGVVFLIIAVFPYLRIIMLKKGIDIYPTFLKRKKRMTKKFET